MNKIFYTLFFLLFFSFFNNEAKAQSSDIDQCTKGANGVDISITTAKTDKTCDTSGATKLTFQLHNLGFCTSAPTMKFPTTGARDVDQRDVSNTTHNQFGANSDFSSCTFTIKQSTATDEILESGEEVEPLPLDELPPKGTYTHAVIVFSNIVKVKGYTQFSTDIKDTTSDQNTGPYCWTNGASILEVGSFGPKINGGNVNVGGGAKCGTLAQAQAQQSDNTIEFKMNNLKTTDENEAAQCQANAGCDTTRSRENTTLGTLDLYFTYASSFITPNITKATMNRTTETSDANSMTMIFGFNNPLIVTDKTTGMDIKVNYNNALALDFEDVKITSAGKTITNISSGSKHLDNSGGYLFGDFFRIRLMGIGPFGIAFVPNEGGSTD